MKKGLVTLLTVGLLLLGVSPVWAGGKVADPTSLASASVLVPKPKETTRLDDSFLIQVTGKSNPFRLDPGWGGGGGFFPANPGLINAGVKLIGRAMDKVVNTAVRTYRAVDKFLDNTIGKFAKYVGYADLLRRLSGGGSNNGNNNNR